MELTAADVATVLRYGVILWLALMCGAVLYRVLVRGAGLSDLLTGSGTRRRNEPQRIVEFFVTLLVAGYVLFIIGGQGAIYDAETKEYWIPEIPDTLLALLAGGKSIFLAGKMAQFNR